MAADLQRWVHVLRTFRTFPQHCITRAQRVGNTTDDLSLGPSLSPAILLLSVQVIFSREKSSGRLVIDGLRVLEESLPPSGAAWKIKGPIYLGGVAPGRAVKNIQVSQQGKTKSLTLEPETH